MPFVVQCPYCREGQVRAPDHAVGQSATCPRCFSCFTLARPSQPPAKTAPNKSPAPPEVAKAKVPASQRPNVTVPAGAPSDPSDGDAAVMESTDELPVLAAPRPIYMPPPHESKPEGTPIPMWLIALVVAGLALVAVQIPYGRIPAVVLSLLGLGIAALSFLVDDRRRRWHWPAAGGVLNALVLLVIVFLPSWLGLTPWRGERDEEYVGPTFVEFTTNRALAGHTKPRPLSDGEWIEANHGGWQRGDTRVWITSVSVGPVEIENASGKSWSKDSRLTIGVAAANVGVARSIPVRPFDERGQPDDPPVTLTDGEGKKLAIQGFGATWSAAGRAKAGPLVFGNSINDLLVFEVPRGQWEFLMLELPAAAVGSTGVIRFQIPASMLGGGLKSPANSFIRE